MKMPYTIQHYTETLSMEKKDWSKQAANQLKAELARAGVGYEELIERLKSIGVEESYKGLASKINRGMFSFVFFTQCMQAIHVKEVRL
jgi:Domain of unknown function (DUF6471)